MNNKEFIQNYINNQVPKSQHLRWNWLLQSELASEDESTLTYAPGVIQEAILSDTKGKKPKSMNSISRRYDQLVRLYTYAYGQCYVKYNPFKSDKFINLQTIVDIYFSNRINVNYVTPDQLNMLVQNLDLCKASSNTKLNFKLYVTCLYNGISIKDLNDLKFSDISSSNQTVLGKPIETHLVDMLNHYRQEMGDENIYDDFVLIPRQKCNHLEEYRAEQKRIEYAVKPQLKITGNTLNYGNLSINDILNSGFVQYLKSKMNIESIADLYYIKPKEGISRSLIARQFNDIAIEFYYNYYKRYKLGDTKYNFSDRQTVIGKTIGYLYKDEDYKKYRVHQIMTE